MGRSVKYFLIAAVATLSALPGCISKPFSRTSSTAVLNSFEGFYSLDSYSWRNAEDRSRVESAVVQIEELSEGHKVKSTSTGFVFKEPGFVMTNAHVVSACLEDAKLDQGYDGSRGPVQCPNFAVRNSLSERFSKVEIIAETAPEDEWDMAVLRVDKLTVTPLEIRLEPPVGGVVDSTSFTNRS